MPRTIGHLAHRVWLQGRDQLPEHLATLCDTFDALHGGWQKEWWDAERIETEVDLRQGREIYDRAADLVPPDSVMQLRADVARYAILRQFGGVTIDVDYHWLRNIDDVVKGRGFVASYEVDGGWICNGFMGAAPGHTLLTQILAGLPAQAEWLAAQGGTYKANYYTGPKYITALLRDNLHRPEVTIRPAVEFQPVPWNKPLAAERASLKRFPHSYAVHRWSHQMGLRVGGHWNTWDTPEYAS
jgi:mannosyltransferase OCH1-like enzyme